MLRMKVVLAIMGMLMVAGTFGGPSATAMQVVVPESSVGTSSTSDAVSTARSFRRGGTYWCGVGGTYTIVNRTTFGPQGWVQLIGEKPNGDRGIYVSRPPDNRDFRYGIRLQRLSDGAEIYFDPTLRSHACTELRRGTRGRAEVRWDGALYVGQWRQG